MINEKDIMINVQKLDILAPMKFISTIFNTEYFLATLVILYMFDIIDSRDLYNILIVKIIVLVIKLLVRRDRPYKSESNIVNLSGKDYSNTLGEFSFPSGHTAMANMLILIITRKYPQIKPLIILPYIVAFSRVFLGVHYFTDVITSLTLSNRIFSILYQK